MNNIVKAVGRFVAWRFLPRIAYPVLIGPLRKKRFILGAMGGEGGGASVYFNMVEPGQTKAFTEVLKRGQIFFDIGANVGYYTILGAKLVGETGKVVAMEPSIRNLCYLYKHRRINRATCVAIVAAACSNVASVERFSSGEDWGTGHLSNDEAVSAGVDFAIVPTVTVDIITQKLNFYPDVMKIDVEGGEFKVLQGARQTLEKGRPKVLLSTHSNELDARCVKFLEELGYTLDVLSEEESVGREYLASWRDHY